MIRGVSTFVLLGWSAALACAQTISTVVGTNWTFPPAPLPAIQAPLGQAGSAVFDPAGNYYLADPSNNLVVKVSASGVLSVTAGNGSPGYSGDNGPATSAQLSAPSGVALDSSGNLFIADTNNNVIRKVTAAGTITTVVGDGTPGYSGDNGPASGALLNGPHGVLVDASGNLLIADTYNGRIRQVDAAGIITTSVGNGNLVQPWSLAQDYLGNLLVADPGGADIRKVSPGGTVITVAGYGVNGYRGDNGPAGLAYLNQPEGVSVDASGNLFIADTLNQRIRKVNTSGIITTIAGNGTAGYTGDGGMGTAASLNNPSSVLLDAAGDLFISDSHNDRIRELTVAGTINTIAGNGGYRFAGDGGLAVSAAIQQPIGVAMDTSGNLLIADTYNNRIRKVDIDGIISTVAGNGSPGYSGDNGPAIAASLNYPQAVASDASGNLFVADTSNNVIRKVTPAGIVSTIAGNGEAGYYGDNGPATSAALHYPDGVAVDTTGNVYIADALNSAVRMVAPGGTIATIAGTGIESCDYGASGPAMAYPGGMALDGEGNLLVADSGCSTVWKLTAGGIMSRTDIPDSPAAVATDAFGDLFTAAPMYQVIQELTPSGTSATVAGDGVRGYAGDNGPAVAAELYFPYGVAVDKTCGLLIADTFNNRIRKVAGLSVNPAAVFLDSTAQSGPALSVVPVASTCAWTTAATAPWISVLSGAGGTGNGTVTFSVQGNTTGAARTGALTIGDQTVSVSQRETGEIFADVTPPDYYFDLADVMYTANITAGCSLSPLEYCPDSDTSRGEMAVFLITAIEHGNSFTYTTTPYFTDVPPSNPYFKFIQKLKDLGITGGCTATTYCPDDSVTRGEMERVHHRLPVRDHPLHISFHPIFHRCSAIESILPVRSENGAGRNHGRLRARPVLPGRDPDPRPDGGLHRDWFVERTPGGGHSRDRCGGSQLGNSRSDADSDPDRSEHPLRSRRHPGSRAGRYDPF
jgi:sugar lactone lactonase YvrE